MESKGKEMSAHIKREGEKEREVAVEGNANALRADLECVVSMFPWQAL